MWRVNDAFVQSQTPGYQIFSQKQAVHPPLWPSSAVQRRVSIDEVEALHNDTTWACLLRFETRHFMATFAPWESVAHARCRRS